MLVWYKINYGDLSVWAMINELFIASQMLAHRQIYIDVNDLEGSMSLYIAFILYVNLTHKIHPALCPLMHVHSIQRYA